MVVQICVGSSCHLKGAERLIELFRAAISEHGLADAVTLAGSFCAGRCNRVGVTVTVNDEVFPGVTPESFPAFFAERVLRPLSEERKERDGMPDPQKIQL